MDVSAVAGRDRGVHTGNVGEAAVRQGSLPHARFRPPSDAARRCDYA